MSLYYGVICRKCGEVQLSAEEYRTQMMAPGCGWRCPECWGPAAWDDAKHDASCVAIGSFVETQGVLDRLGLTPLPEMVRLTRTGRLESVPELQQLRYGPLIVRTPFLALDMAELELRVVAAGYGGRSMLVSRLGYQPEEG